ncbi:MAG: DUF6602 domain-containing protein [Halorhabdus sp.]
MAPLDEYLGHLSGQLIEAADGGFSRERDARDVFVTQFLTAVYPDEYVAVGGETVDANGESSNRVGTVLYDQRLPVLSASGRSRYLSAGVHAHVDVKADLFGEVDHALSKVDSIKRLDVDRMPVDDVERQDRLFSAVFAFEGPDPETFKDSVLRYYANRNSLEGCVDLICVRDEYVMITLFSGPDPGFQFLRTGADSLTAFYVNLAGAVSTAYWDHRPVVSAYMERTEADEF